MNSMAHTITGRMLTQAFNTKLRRTASVADPEMLKRDNAIELLNRQYELKLWLEEILGRRIGDEPNRKLRDRAKRKWGDDDDSNEITTSFHELMSEGKASVDNVSSPQVDIKLPQSMDQETDKKMLRRSVTSALIPAYVPNMGGDVEKAPRRKSKKIVNADDPLKKKKWGLQHALANGVILCQLIREVCPEHMPHIHEDTKIAFRCKENICYFIQAAEQLGVPRWRLFQVSDLYDNMNFLKVVECLEDLSLVLSENGFDIPLCPLLEEIDWSEEQIQFSEDIVVQSRYRSRTNKSATLRARNNSAFRESLHVVAKSPEIVEKVASVLSDYKNQEAELTRKIIKLQAIVRGRIARRQFLKRVADEAYRKRVADEILSTERSYVLSLKILVKVYYEPLKKAIESGKPIISQANLKAIFSDALQVILLYNTKFLTDLEPRVVKWNSSKRIGDIFLEFTNFLKVYTQYVKDFTVAQSTFDSIKEKTKFAKFLYQTKQLPESRGCDLSQYLIQPVQRIPRYNLLLTDLVRHTWKDHPDYPALTAALKTMQGVAAYINERKRDAESINKIIDIQHHLSGLNENLTSDPVRRFIRDDTLQWMEGHGRYTERIVYLFNDRFIVAKKTRTSNQRCVHNFNMSDIEIIPKLDRSYPKNSFSIYNEDANVTLIFVASSEENWELLTTDIRKAKDDMNRQLKFQNEIAMKRSIYKAKEAKEVIEDMYKKISDGTWTRTRKPKPQIIRYERKVLRAIIIEHPKVEEEQRDTPRIRSSIPPRLFRSKSTVPQEEKEERARANTMTHMDAQHYATITATTQKIGSKKWFGSLTAAKERIQNVSLSELFAPLSRTSSSSSLQKNSDRNSNRLSRSFNPLTVSSPSLLSSPRNSVKM